jgi:hypothetical protein
LWTTSKCDALVTAAHQAGKFAFQPYLTWIGIACLAVGMVMSAQKPTEKAS